MHPTIKAALTKAQNYVDMFEVTNQTARDEYEAQLQKLTKKELVAKLLDVYAPAKTDGGKIETTVYRILTDPDCVWSDHATIATLVSAKFGSKTSESSVAWYASKCLEKGQDVKPRKPRKELARLILDQL